MLHDLTQVPEQVTADADVLIVGAGVAGLLLANCLRERGRRVLVLESGDRHQSSDIHPLNRVVQVATEYRGATYGRFRCLGGTSTRWGGALLPFLEHDFAARAYLGVPQWPVEYQDVVRYLPALEGLFGVDGLSYDEQFACEAGIAGLLPKRDENFFMRFAKWPTFANRNLASLFGERIRVDPDLQVWINATVTEFELDVVTGRLMGAVAKNSNGRTLKVTARNIIICAGAIESTRLLLMLDARYGQRVFAGCNALGRYLHDHVSAVAAEIKPRDVRRLNRLAGFRFVGNTMRGLRFELAPDIQRARQVGSAFGHIAFKPSEEGGFSTLRNLMRAVQQRKAPSARLLCQAFRDIPYFGKLAYWRAVHKQLYWPVPATYSLHVVVEQPPMWRNSITLCGERDSLGVPLAQIDWRVGEQEQTTFAVYAQHFAEYWARNELAGIGDLRWMSGESDRSEDIYHPGGSTRMGRDSREAVVDSQLRTFAVPNLWVASTSVFPSGASANPTLMLMLFTMRLADTLVNEG